MVPAEKSCPEGGSLFFTCRFHMLSEFDEGKRSCRKRLDGHNRRRRKPQHDIMNLGGFFPYGQVNQFAIYPQSTPRSGQNSDSMHMVNRQQTFSISFSETFKAPKAFAFSQDGGSMLNSSRQINLLTEHNSNTRASSICNSLPGTLGPECALSLLSSSLHRPSLTAGQAQVTSSLACIAAASQDTTAPAVAYSSGVGHHAFVPDAVFEDPSQALPFPWQ
ncbi:hypothetical protein EJB05_47527, partial [Eragrostis curvula]